MGTVRYTTIDGEIIAEKRNGVRREYVPDPLGSTVALLDDTQTQTDTFQYWPYGEVATRTGTTDTPFQYVGVYGYFVNKSIGYYVRARWFAPQIGYWLSDDPLGMTSTDRNLLRYASSNPTSFRDPSGLQGVPGDCPNTRPDDCTDPCNSAKNCGWDYGDWGGTVCCNGTLYACDWYPRIVDGKLTPPGIHQCILDHEIGHILRSKPCPRYGLCRGTEDPIQIYWDECTQYTATVTCMLAAKDKDCSQWTGANKTWCEKHYDNVLCTQCAQAERYCNRLTHTGFYNQWCTVHCNGSKPR